MIGTRIAIHAARRRVKAREFTYAEEWHLDSSLGPGWRARMEYGVIVATAVVQSCWQIDRPSKAITNPGREAPIHDRVNFHFGDFSDGRWIWDLADVRRVSPSVPCRGRQGIFIVDLEEDQIHA